MFGFGKKADERQKLNQPIPPGWEIEDLGLLGEGGMSRVHRVRDETLGREVALKVLRPELLREPEAIDRFLDEARITSQLDHPNVPPVYALAADKKKTTCFTMKVLDGQSLQQFLLDPQNVGTDALFKALEVLVRVCDAVSFAHEKEILHCDLKPHNVMVGTHGQIYLVDWGLARRKKDLPQEGKHDRIPVGTPAYMAPEQAHGRNHALDERTDIFMLGGTLYRILAGRPPYIAATAEATLDAAREEHIEPPERLAPPGRIVPRRLSAIAMKALSPKPADRYQTAQEFKRDVEDFIRGTARLPEQHFAPGESIVREGEPGDCAYVILDGHCQATRVVAGKTQSLRLLGPGEMFGEAAVLTGSPRLATVTAMMDTTVAVVDRTFFAEEMERTSYMALAIRTVATSFLDLNGQTAALIQEQTLFKAVEQVLRELALAGRSELGGARSVPWNETLVKVCQKVGVPAEALADRISRQDGLRLDVPGDRLYLSPSP